MINIAVLKIGNIGVAPLFEFLFDERAERENLTFRVFGSGSKMTFEKAIDNINSITLWKPDLTVFITPNASLKTPKMIIEEIIKHNIPVIVISDSPALKSKDWFEEKKIGYIIITGDPMIGARREFLDPTEVATFNSDIIRVLSNTGVLRAIQKIIDKIIIDIENKKLKLPNIIIDTDYLIKDTFFSNPYAKAKAIAAFKLAELTGNINIKACFKVQDWIEYTTLTATAHEILRIAAKLADEAREIEKSNNKLLREPHDISGKILKKEKLFEKPK